MTPLDQVPWTPGEWTFGYVGTHGYCIYAGGKHIATSILYKHDGGEANARLIAESPTMAALLERLLAAMKWRTHSLTEDERTALTEARALLSRLGRGK